MSMDARRRSSIYGKLVPLIGEQNANALMSEFPAVEADELVTKQFLRAELADLRTEMSGLGADLRTEMSGLGADLRGEMAGHRTEMAEQFHQATVRFGAALAGATALVVAAIPLLS